MISARKGFYIVWIVLALNLHYGWVKGISGLLETDLFNLGAGYTITVWHFYTYFVMVYTGWFIGYNLQRSAEIVARSNVTAIFAAAVVLLGIIALVDIAVACITGSGELFLLQLLFNTVCDPSLTLEHLTGNLTPSTNETLTVIQGEVVNGPSNLTF